MKENYENLTSDEMKMVLEAAKKIGIVQDEVTNNPPYWWDGKQIDEISICEWMKAKHALMFVGNFFYDIDGFQSEKKLEKEILEYIEPYVKTNLSMKIKKLMDVLKIKTCQTIYPSRKTGYIFLMGHIT